MLENQDSCEILNIGRAIVFQRIPQSQGASHLRSGFRCGSQVGLAHGLRFVILELVQAMGSQRFGKALRTGFGLALVCVQASASFGCSDAASFGTQRGQPNGESAGPALSGEVSQEATADGDAGTSTTSPAAPTVDELGDRFNEQECPDEVQRIESTECDPLGGQSQCGLGQGCYPYVHYPSSRCDPETFGTRCDTSGAGVQGERCAGERCAHGFLCVVTGRGTECAELCRMPGPNTCPDGFICGSLDIDGFGVCI